MSRGKLKKFSKKERTSFTAGCAIKEVRFSTPY
jgi:hypothetical protein